MLPCPLGNNNYGLNICLEDTTAFDEDEWITVTQPWTIMHNMLYFGDQ